MKKILVTGGLGYIGSHIVIELINNGFEPVIVDNLSNSRKEILKKIEKITRKKILFYKIDLRNDKKLSNIFKKHKLYCVIHCAGHKSVEESTKKPLVYLNDNIASTLSLLKCMNLNNVFKIIFSSSATVYNDKQKMPLRETSQTGKTKNPYGTSKYIIEKILMDLAKFDKKWTIRIARYFNPISNHSSGLLKEESKNNSNNLIPIILKVIKKKALVLKIFGKNYKTKDGTCIRDYIHVMDLAKGHIAMLKSDQFKRKGLKVYNFGTGKGSSVLEIIKKFEKQTNIQINYIFTKRRKGDAEVTYCSTRRVSKDLKWKSKYNLDKALMDIKKIL